MGAPDATGDSIYNGAHDNALGVAKVLAANEVSQRLEYSQTRENNQAVRSNLLGSSEAIVAIKNQVEQIARLAAMGLADPIPPKM